MRGECSCPRAVAVALAGVLVVVEIVRGLDAVCACEEDAVCEGCEALGEGPFCCWMAEWARKAARKFAKKGRWVDIVGDGGGDGEVDSGCIGRRGSMVEGSGVILKTRGSWEKDRGGAQRAGGSLYTSPASVWSGLKVPTSSYISFAERVTRIKSDGGSPAV